MPRVLWWFRSTNPSNLLLDMHAPAVAASTFDDITAAATIVVCGKVLGKEGGRR